MVEPNVDGWEHVLTATSILKEAIEELFRLPELAQQRAIDARAEHGKAHGDDLACGCWQAAMSATALLSLCGRHADAVVHLADVNPGFAPSAPVLARASMESALRVAWLLEPSTAEEREHRWVALERENNRFEEAIGMIDSEELVGRTEVLDDLCDRVGGVAVRGTPTVEKMAEVYGGDRPLYLFYRMCSQPVHGTIAGASAFDHDAVQEWMALGGKGDWIEAQTWAIPIAAAWEGLRIVLPKYRDLLAPEAPLRSLDRHEDFSQAISKMPPNYQARRQLGLDMKARPVSRPTLNRAQRRRAERQRRH